MRVAEVDFEGESFEMAERVGLMPMMRFAKVAKAGVDSDDLAGLVAMYDLLEQCIAPAEWDRFQAHADKVHADGEQLMSVVAKVFEVLSQRPTSRPSVSSDGPSTTAPNSTDDSSLRVIRRLEQEGRPSWALLVEETAAARQTA